MAMSFHDWVAQSGWSAAAVGDVFDSPLAGRAEPVARAGNVGEVCDLVSADGLLFVDFGAGAVACLPGEVVPSFRAPPTQAAADGVDWEPEAPGAG